MLLAGSIASEIGHLTALVRLCVPSLTFCFVDFRHQFNPAMCKKTYCTVLSPRKSDSSQLFSSCELFCAIRTDSVLTFFVLKFALGQSTDRIYSVRSRINSILVSLHRTSEVGITGRRKPTCSRFRSDLQHSNGTNCFVRSN